MRPICYFPGTPAPLLQRTTMCTRHYASLPNAPSSSVCGGLRRSTTRLRRSTHSATPRSYFCSPRGTSYRSTSNLLQGFISIPLFSHSKFHNTRVWGFSSEFTVRRVGGPAPFPIRVPLLSPQPYSTEIRACSLPRRVSGLRTRACGLARNRTLIGSVFSAPRDRLHQLVARGQGLRTRGVGGSWGANH